MRKKVRWKGKFPYFLSSSLPSLVLLIGEDTSDHWKTFQTFCEHLDNGRLSRKEKQVSLNCKHQFNGNEEEEELFTAIHSEFKLKKTLNFQKLVFQNIQIKKIEI